MKNSSKQLEKKSNIYVASGLLVGVVIGTLLFVFTKQPWHIGAGACIGIVTGAKAASNSKQVKRIL